MTAKVKVGQTVMVLDGHGRARAEPKRGTVVKVGHVWIDVHREGQRWGWRFRLDTQTDGSNFGHPPQFYTLDQWAQHEREESALAFLRAQDIMIGYASPWRTRMVELATLLGWSPPPLDEH
jgi:hypothetical protein